MKILTALLSIMITTLACGQLDVGIEPVPNSLSDTQLITTVEDKPDDQKLPDQNKSDIGGELEYLTQFIAYTDSNTNIWVLEIGSGNPRQITFNASLYDGTNTPIEYGSPQLSSDGTLLVYSKAVGIPVDGGLEFTSDIWVENMATGEINQILTGRTLGFSWKPGTHELAYTTAIENMDYWIPRGQPSPNLATGINLLNVDSNEIIELVQPESGYTLSGPKWTADGRFIYFSEVIAMEGSGYFAYYDFENEEYVAWEEAVGNVSWSHDSELITYARQPYTASGEERLYLRAGNGEEQLIGQDYEGVAYATQPSFSPTENKIAYVVYFEGPMTSSSSIMVLDIDNGETRTSGNFEDVWEIAWTLDGKNLVFSSGKWDSREIVLLNIIDGSQSIIAYGRQLSLNGE